MDEAVGRRIQDLRENKNYTRECLAEKIEISSKFLYEIERNKRGFSAETLLKLSKEFGVSCDYILTGNYTYVIEKEKSFIGRQYEVEDYKKYYMQEILVLLEKICQM